MQCKCGGYLTEKRLTYDQYYECEACKRVLVTDYQRDKNDKNSKKVLVLRGEFAGEEAYVTWEDETHVRFTPLKDREGLVSVSTLKTSVRPLKKLQHSA